MTNRERTPLEWTRFSYNAFFDDPAVCAMGDHFIGPYMRLLHAAHRATIPGHLPNDQEWLRSQSRLPLESWEIFSTVVQRAFKVTPKYWIQKRVVREHARARTISSQNSAAGKLSAARRKLATPVEQVSTTRLDETRLDKREAKALGRFAPDPAFSDSWNLYPNHKGRSPALKVWTRLSDEDRALVPAAIETQKQWPEWSDPQFIPRFSTWLNQRRWEDEPTKAIYKSGEIQWPA